MISVPNLLQQLNGNRQKLVLLFLFVITILSCTGSRKSSGYIPGQGIPDNKPGVIKGKDSVEKKKQEVKITDTFDKVYPLIKKNSYKIAYILPFEFSSIYDEDENMPPNISRAAVEFYMGSIVAMENTTKVLPQNVKFVVKFLDTENSEQQIKRKILPALDLFKPDLIIGPFTAIAVRIVSKYALEKKISMVCPVSNVTECIMNNPYLITEKPSLYSQLAAFRNYTMSNFPDHKIILFGSNKKENDTSLFLLKRIDSVFIKKISTVIINTQNWNSSAYSKFLGNGKYIFYIPLNNEFVVNSIVSSLVSSGKTEDLVVIASYKWLEFSSVDISYLLSLNIHFAADHYFNYKDSSNLDFIKAYREKYNTEPSKFAFLGYEVSVFYANALGSSGNYFQKNIFLEKFPGIYKAYFTDIKKGKLAGFEKSRLKYLMFMDYELVEEKTD